jgi:hypothetical protein
MDIQTAAKYADVGYRIKRASWDLNEWISEEILRRHPISFTLPDLLANDWEIITVGIVKDFGDNGCVEYEE